MVFRSKPPWQVGTCAASLGLLAWVVWYQLVLRQVGRRGKPWGPRWLAASLSGVLHCFGCRWLRFTHNAEEAVAGGFERGKQFICVWHPHGVLTITAVFFISYWSATDYPAGVRGKSFCVVAPLLLRIPGLAEFLLLCHARSADSRTFSSLLSSGASVAVQPGGLQEQVRTDEKQERVLFSKRLGFIRMALKHDVPLVPMYAFGENQLYRTPAWVQGINSWFYRKLHIGNLLVLGLCGIPACPLLPCPWLLPGFRKKLNLRIGRPIDVGPRDDDPSDERVKEAFDKYIVGLRELFDTHKDTCLEPEVAARGLEVDFCD